MTPAQWSSIQELPGMLGHFKNPYIPNWNVAVLPFQAFENLFWILEIGE